MKRRFLAVVYLCMLTCLAGCGSRDSAPGTLAENVDGETAEARQQQSGREEDSSQQTEKEEEPMRADQGIGEPYTIDTKIEEVINDPIFGDYGRLIFPVDTGFYSGDTLGGLGLTWYRNIDSQETGLPM